MSSLALTLTELAHCAPGHDQNPPLNLHALSIARYCAHGTALVCGVPLTLTLGKICTDAAGVGCSVATGFAFTINIVGLVVPCVYGCLWVKNRVTQYYNDQGIKKARSEVFKDRDGVRVATYQDIKSLGAPLFDHPELFKSFNAPQALALAAINRDRFIELAVGKVFNDEVNSMIDELVDLLNRSKITLEEGIQQKAVMLGMPKEFIDDSESGNI